MSHNFLSDAEQESQNRKAGLIKDTPHVHFFWSHLYEIKEMLKVVGETWHARLPGGEIPHPVHFLWFKWISYSFKKGNWYEIEDVSGGINFYLWEGDAGRQRWKNRNYGNFVPSFFLGPGGKYYHGSANPNVEGITMKTYRVEDGYRIEVASEHILDTLDDLQRVLTVSWANNKIQSAQFFHPRSYDNTEVWR